MVVERYKKIYKLVEELQTKNIKNKNENAKDDCCVLRDIIKKENIIINMYLICLKQISPVKLDEDYKVLPIEEKEMYQYGTIITMPIEEGYIDINEVFNNCVYDKDEAIDGYKKLKDKLETLSEHNILDEVENSIIGELNQ